MFGLFVVFWLSFLFYLRNTHPPKMGFQIQLTFMVLVCLFFLTFHLPNLSCPLQHMSYVQVTTCVSVRQHQLRQRLYVSSTNSCVMVFLIASWEMMKPSVVCIGYCAWEVCCNITIHQEKKKRKTKQTNKKQ